MTEATQRPWAVIQDQYGNESIVDSMGDFVVEMAEQTIDADLIVKAVNNHDALVAALEAAIPMLHPHTRTIGGGKRARLAAEAALKQVK